MSDTLLFLISFIVSVRTFSYGIWTVSNKNILGGFFVFLLSILVIALVSYILFWGRT